MATEQQQKSKREFRRVNTYGIPAPARAERAVEEQCDLIDQALLFADEARRLGLVDEAAIEDWDA